MQVETLTMDPRIARIHYADYLKKCRENREDRKKKLAKKAKEAGKLLGQVRIEKTQMEKEDEELKRLYLELKKGNTILTLPTVMQNAGLNDQHLPALAICRATSKWCRISDSSGQIIFFDADSHWGWQASQRDRVSVKRTVFPAELLDSTWRRKNNHPDIDRVRAMVPSVPVHLRPSNLGDYHILWEAEWDKAPPVDPILLKKVSDTNFVVIAQWDLSPIERAVLLGKPE